MESIQTCHVKGLAFAAAAVFIWSGSVVALRFGVVSNLNAYDLTALRFGTAAPLLLPVILRNTDTLQRLGLCKLFMLVACFGAPYIILLSLALRTTTAASAGALNPGAMAIFAVILGSVLLHCRVGKLRFIGIMMITFGIWAAATKLSGGLTPGHLILILTGGMWAGYAFTIHKSGVPALMATAVVAVGSAILYLPIYFIALPHEISGASTNEIMLQVGVQGVLVSLAAVYAFNRSTELLGLTIGASLPALIPLVSLGLGYLLLNEPASYIDLATAMIIGFGVALILTSTRRLPLPENGSKFQNT